MTKPGQTKPRQEKTWTDQNLDTDKTLTGLTSVRPPSSPARPRCVAPRSRSAEAHLYNIVIIDDYGPGRTLLGYWSPVGHDVIIICLQYSGPT